MGIRSTAQLLNRHFNKMQEFTLFLPLFELKSRMHDIIVRRNVFYVEFVVKYFCYIVLTIKFSLKNIKYQFQRKLKSQ